MKTILFVIAMALASWLVPAHADPLPKIFAGKWCLVGNETVREEHWEEYKKGNECPKHDYITFCRHSSVCGGGGYYYVLTEQGCKFIAVKKVITHRLREYTHHVKKETITTFYTMARCYGEGDESENNTWIENREVGLPGSGSSSGQPGLYLFSRSLK